MMEKKAKDPLHAKFRDAGRGLDPHQGAPAVALVPGKSTLAASYALSAPLVGIAAQLVRSMTAVVLDLTHLEAANQSGDLQQALQALGTVVRFVKHAPEWLMQLPRGAQPELEVGVCEVIARAELAIANAPKISRPAIDAARRGDFTQWDADVAPWREARRTKKMTELPSTDAPPRQAETRLAAWQSESAPLARALGVSPEIRSDETSRRLTDALGARGIAVNNTVHLHPDRIKPGTPVGREVLTHELVHIAQAKLPGPRNRGAAETEARSIARSGVLRAPVHAISRHQLAADNGAETHAHRDEDAVPQPADPSKTDNDEPPDLRGAPYRWVPGTYSAWVLRSWFRGAADFSVSRSDDVAVGDAPDAHASEARDSAAGGVQWASPSRVRELLMMLRDHGMLTWASPERIAKASGKLGIPAKGPPVQHIRLDTTVFAELGLPPGTSAVVGKSGDRGLDAVIAVPDVHLGDGEEFALSEAAAQQLVKAVEGFTGLPIVPALRDKILHATLKARLSAGTAHFVLRESLCHSLFGKPAFDRWYDRAPTHGESGPAFDRETGSQSFGDLSAQEVAYAQRWLASHVTETSSGRPVVMSRLLVEAMHRVDELSPDVRRRVLAMLSGGASATAASQTGQTGKTRTDEHVTAVVIERMIQRATFDAERQAAHVPVDEKPGNERPPVFDCPLPARIDQLNGLVLSGENVELTVRIDWPEATTADQHSEYTWRPHKARIDWVFERMVAGRNHQEHARTAAAGAQNGNVKHRFVLEPGETSAVWTVRAFVHHNFFQPAQLEPISIEVKTEAQRLTEMRAEAFAPLGTPAIANADHDFPTGALNELSSHRAYDRGVQFRGELPAEFHRQTTTQRTATLMRDIQTHEAMLRYLRNDGNADAIAACEHHIAKLRDTMTAIDADGNNGWQAFEVRGTFLGRENHVADGPLDLHAAVRRQLHTPPVEPPAVPTPYEQVHVSVRDLSRRTEAENYRFEGYGDTFERALEAAFVDLCKHYPNGTVSVLAEELTPEGTQPTGKTVGFALDTGSVWEDVKAKAFDPAVNIAVNIAGAIAAVFVPQIALPLLVLYNQTQNIDELLNEHTIGTATVRKDLMHLAQLGLDILPMAGQAPIVRTSRAAFAMFHVAGLAGQAILMKTQIEGQIASLRDGEIQGMARLYAEYVALEKSTNVSDPRRATMKAEIDQRAEQIRKIALDVWTSAIGQLAIVAVPSHVAGIAHETIRTHKLASLEGQRRFVHSEGIEPHYEPERGQIVGDQATLSPAAINRLTRVQDAHMRQLGARLAAELGVDLDRIVLRPGDSTQIWADGNDIQVRYSPGTDVEQALAGWIRDAAQLQIRAPGDGPHATPKASARSTTTMGSRDATSTRNGTSTHDATSTNDGTSTREIPPSRESPETSRGEPVAQQSPDQHEKILLAGDDNVLRDAARRAQPLAGYIDVIVHADADRFWVVRDGEDIALDHRALATYVRKHGLEDQKIRLIACEAGMWPHAVAQHLANKLGVEVLAPSMTAWIDGGGNVGVGSRNEHQGKWQTFRGKASSADGAKAQLQIPEEPHVPLDLNAPEHAPPLQVRFDHRERYHASRHDELQAVLGKPLHVNPNMVDGVRMIVSREQGVFGTQYHVRGISIGSQTRAADIWAHAELVRLVERYNGIVGALRKLWERLRGNAGPRYPHGSRGWVLAQEIEKVRKHIESTQIMENTGLLDAERATAEIAHLQGAEAYFRDELRDLEVYSPGRAHGQDDLFELSRPDVGQTTREAEAAGYKRPGHDGNPIDGVAVDPEWYYYRRSKADPSVFELARKPEAPAKAPLLQARVVGRRFIGIEPPATEAAVKLAHIPAGKELETLYKPDGSMAPYAAMLERMGLATKNVIDGAALILRRQLAERPNATIDTWRHAVKDYFRQRVLDKLVDPTLGEGASYRQMRQMLDGLGSSDRGNLVEAWYLTRNRPDAKRQVSYDIERTSGRNAGKTERRVADGLHDKTIIEVKDGANPIDPEQFGAYVDWMDAPDDTGRPSIEQLTYVFTKPEGGLANLEFMAKALKHSDLKKRLVVQVFDRGGKMHEVRTPSGALALLQQLKADL